MSWDPELFRLVRDEDETGVSGVGVVASGCVWPDGTVAMRWRPGVASASSTAVYGSIEDVKKIHGHGGKTRAEWVDNLADMLVPIKEDR